jgi:hypothetical protein
LYGTAATATIYSKFEQNSGSMSHYTTKRTKTTKIVKNRDKTTEFLVILTGFGRF